jgi:hypothetical protein
VEAEGVLWIRRLAMDQVSQVIPAILEKESEEALGKVLDLEKQ